MKMKSVRAYLVVFSLLFSATPVFADAESERANLARLAGELEQISQAISKYRSDASNFRQYSFDYDALSKDINSMRSGIVEYISKDLSLARDIAPLTMQYIQDNPGEK